MSGTEVQYESVQQKYPVACAGLNGPITDEEVAAVLGKLKNVGAGPDGMPPVVLRDHANHMSCQWLFSRLCATSTLFLRRELFQRLGNSTDYFSTTRVIIYTLRTVTVIGAWV